MRIAKPTALRPLYLFGLLPGVQETLGPAGTGTGTESATWHSVLFGRKGPAMAGKQSGAVAPCRGSGILHSKRKLTKGTSNGCTIHPYSSKCSLCLASRQQRIQHDRPILTEEETDDFTTPN